jgi:hypothetical protein
MFLLRGRCVLCGSSFALPGIFYLIDINEFVRIQDGAAEGAQSVVLN